MNGYVVLFLSRYVTKPPLSSIWMQNVNWSDCAVNFSPPGQNGRHFADDLFRYIFMNEKLCILIKISLNFVLKGLINNNPALVLIMAWRRIGDKPLPGPMLTLFTDAYVALGGNVLRKDWNIGCVTTNLTGQGIPFRCNEKHYESDVKCMIKLLCGSLEEWLRWQQVTHDMPYRISYLLDMVHTLFMLYHIHEI